MAGETTDLTIAVHEGASWSRRLSITVPADRVQRTRGRIAEQIARGVKLPGFRKGKLPPRVIEQRFGPSIDQETLDRSIQEAYREALESQGITPISEGKVANVKYDRGTELSFEVEVEVRPEITLDRLHGFTVSRPPAEVSDQDIQTVLERLRDDRGEWEPMEAGARPQYGDQVLVEITALSEEGGTVEEPRSYRIVVGEGQAIPDIEAAILTLAPGESGEFTVTFPEDFPQENRRGQQQRLRIDLKEARRKVLPEVDEAFARGVGDFESVDALQERIRSDLEEDARERAEDDVRRQLVEQILEANRFDPPASMVDRYLDYLLHGPEDEKGKRRSRTPEEEERFAQVREGLRPQAEWGLKRTLVVERIAEQEGLRATQDEIDQRVETLAKKHGRSPSEVWIQLEKSGQLEVLEREITEDKVFDYLTSQNTIV